MSALITESLQARLARLVPGAKTEHIAVTSAKPAEKWQVVRPFPPPLRGMKVLAVGATEREAIDRAIFLFGGRS